MNNWERRRIRSKVNFNEAEKLHSSFCNSVGFSGLFAGASFIKQHLSIHEIKNAVKDCNDEDLTDVGRDLGLIREVGQAIRTIIRRIASGIGSDFTDGLGVLLPAIFIIGRLIVLVDLSLRRNGFSDVIDRLLAQLVMECRRAENEDVLQTLDANSKAFTDAIKSCFRELADDDS